MKTVQVVHMYCLHHKEHSPCPLWTPICCSCAGKESLYVVRVIRNTTMWQNAVASDIKHHWTVNGYV